MPAADKTESIRELTHELAHVERLLTRLQRLRPAPQDPASELLDLVVDLRADGARRLRKLRLQAGL